MSRKVTMTSKRDNERSKRKTPKRAGRTNMKTVRAGRRSRRGTRIDSSFSEARESEAQEIERSEGS